MNSRTLSIKARFILIAVLSLLILKKESYFQDQYEQAAKQIIIDKCGYKYYLIDDVWFSTRPFSVVQYKVKEPTKVTIKLTDFEKRDSIIIYEEFVQDTGVHCYDVAQTNLPAGSYHYQITRGDTTVSGWVTIHHQRPVDNNDIE